MKINVFFSLLLLLATFIMLFISYISWRRRKLPFSFSCSLVMLAASLYAYGYSHEITNTSLEKIKFWLKVEYIGIPFISTLWLIMIIQYTGFDAYLKKRVYALLFVIPVITLVLHYTNDMHHLLYKDISIDCNFLFPVAVFEKGFWYWVFISYSYLLVIAGLILPLTTFKRATPLFRKQAFVMMLVSGIPWLFNVVYITGSFGYHLDITPLGLTLSGILLTWAIYKFNVLRFTPIALEKVFEFMTDGVIVVDNENSIVNFNKTASKIIPELNRITIRESSAEHFLRGYPALIQVLKQEEEGECELKICSGDFLRFYQVRSSTISDIRARIGRILVLNDITDSRRSHDKLTAAITQLDASNILKDKLFTVVTNDIRDPLAILVNLSEFLVEEKEYYKEDSREMICEIQGQVRRAFIMVENLLEWARSKKGGNVFIPEVLELSKLVQEAINAIKIKAEVKGIRILPEIPDGTAVYADKEMLELVLRNLLSNAIKFTGKNGSITITAAEEKDMVVLAVKDTGMGIQPEKVQMLFQDIEGKSSSGTEGEKGAGLGLLICREFIHCTGGEIWVDSTPGEGSTFFISIPAGGKSA
ncbi:MAG TPA: histidine kinase N-terminal 7TM domain-containing protein [Candidatus Nitrosocosmicus sp.]|nr:histidine kinase N-terminal 7TM domain-containing protein [Candidatus Nitrosocosmicus sp.]